MKKLVSVLTLFVMLMSMMSLSVGAAETVADEGLVFDMDLSNYGTDSTISNSVENNDSTISYSTNKPAYGGTIPGTNVPYINFHLPSDVTVPQYRYFSVADNDFIGQNELTIEAWIKPEGFETGYKSANTLFALNGSKNYWEFSDVAGASAQHVYSIDGDSYKTNQQKLTAETRAPYDGVWTHVVFTRKFADNAWTGTIYMNGKEVTTSKITNSKPTLHTPDDEKSDTSATLKIGSRGGKTWTFLGSIAEFKVYNTVLTPASISTKFNNTKNSYSGTKGDNELVFDMDLTNATQENISVTSGGYGSPAITVNGAPTLGTLSNGTKYLTFNTLNPDTSKKDAGILVNDKYFADQNEMTVETWIKASDFSSTANIIFSADSIVGCFYQKKLWFDPNGDNASCRAQVNDFSSYSDKWIHLVFIKEWNDNTNTLTATIYKDGKIFGSAKSFDMTELNIAKKNATNSLYIGNKSALNAGFEGSMATFKVYNEALDAATISAKYDASKNDFYPLVKVSDINTDTNTVTATFDESLNTTDAYIVMALYDDKGNMLKAVEGTYIAIDDITLKEGYYVCCFVWENENTLKPLAKKGIAYCL